jgi:predicted Ser/Thr protein kinase
MSEAAAALASGAVFGRYVLVEMIGRGAMGEVWAAIDPDLDRKIALKLLRTDRSARPEDRARLAAEARAMARLTHANVVTIHDVGELGEQLFIAMEFVAGETLDRWMSKGPHTCDEVLGIMRQAAAGLAAAHGVGLVHRDFKPANVIIGNDGRVRVLDFGLARPDVVTGGEGDTSESRARRIQGTPVYMSPEQHRGATVDARSDLFSFCVTLFEALYGVRPFRGDNRLTVALAIVEGRVSEPPADARARVPEWIHAIVMRGLAGEPEQRFPDMGTLLAALERSPEQVRRRRMHIAGMVAGVIAVGGLMVMLWPEPAQDPCDAAGDAMAEVWNADARSRLRERIDGVAGQRLSEGLDQHAQAWADASAQLCRDRRARRLTERLQTTREACLAEQREAVQTLLRLAEEHPAVRDGLEARPFAAVRALGMPSDCVDRPAPADDRPLPSEAQRTARIELRLALALVEGGELPNDALARVGDELEGDPELSLLLGRVAAKRGERSVAEARLHGAAAAVTSRDPKLAALAWLALGDLELANAEAATGAGERAAMLDRAAQLIAYADALLPESELDSRAELGLLAGRLALLDVHAANPELLDAAIDRLDEQQLRAPDLLIALLEVRARLHDRSGNDSLAVADRSRAEQVSLVALGSTR